MSRIFVRKVFHKLLSKYLWQSLLLVKWHTGILGLWTQKLDDGLWMLDSQRWALDAGLWTMNAGLWILDAGLWMLDIGCYTLAVGLWALDTIIDFFRTKSEGSY